MVPWQAALGNCATGASYKIEGYSILSTLSEKRIVDPVNRSGKKTLESARYERKELDVHDALDASMQRF